MLCQKSACPYNKDWAAAKRVLRYLKGTVSMKLSLKVNEEEPIKAYCDASWGDRDCGKSTSGYAVYVHGALVMWKSIKQIHVSTSTCEAEYSALSDCEIQLEWLKQLVNDLSLTWDQPVSVWYDSSSAEQLAGDHGCRTRSKHITIRHGNVREAVKCFYGNKAL